MARKKKWKMDPKFKNGFRQQVRRGWIVPCPSCGGNVEGYEDQDWGGCVQCGRVWRIVDLPENPTWMKVFVQMPLKA